jgi:hypothetical protein
LKFFKIFQARQLNKNISENSQFGKNIIYSYKKFYVSNRKKLTKVNNKFKNSNVTIINKFLSISTRSGNKRTVFANFQKFYSNYIFGFFFSNDYNLNSASFINDAFDYESDINANNNGFNEDFFKNFPYFNLVKKLIMDDSSYINANNLINFVLPLYNTLFTIKVKKLGKKMKAKYKKKYLYKLNYVYPKNRVNLTLKFMNFQSLQVKNYYLPERYTKMFASIVLAPQDSLA